MRIYKVVYTSDSLSNIAYWDNKSDALYSAVFCILDAIRFEWDLTKPAFRSEAEAINNLAQAGLFENAILYWNSSSLQSCFTINVFSDYTRDSSQLIIPLNLLTFPSLTPPPTVVWAPMQPGANCRKCPDSNPYAYADQPDGTYLCKQCKLFMDVFC